MREVPKINHSLLFHPLPLNLLPKQCRIEPIMHRLVGSILQFYARSTICSLDQFSDKRTYPSSCFFGPACVISTFKLARGSIDPDTSREGLHHCRIGRSSEESDLSHVPFLELLRRRASDAAGEIICHRVTQQLRDVTLHVPLMDDGELNYLDGLLITIPNTKLRDVLTIYDGE